MKKLWHKVLKPFLKTLGVHRPYRALLDFIEAQKLKNKDTEKVFSDIYKKNRWGNDESVSGPGSDLKDTEKLRKALPSFLDKYGVEDFIDLPCGDFNWMRHVDYPFQSYLGLDVVDDIIKENQEKFGNDIYRFQKLDCLKDRIPDADLLMCRDLLIHFSHDDIFKFFENIKRSNIKYLLTTHFKGIENKDIQTGQWRILNLCTAPFHLPEPVDHILEETMNEGGKYKDIKYLALWRTEDLFKAA